MVFLSSDLDSPRIQDSESGNIEQLDTPDEPQNRDIRSDVLSFFNDLGINMWCLLIYVSIFGNLCILAGATQLGGDCSTSTGIDIGWSLIFFGVNLISFSIFYSLLMSDFYEHFPFCNNGRLEIMRNVLIFFLGSTLMLIAISPSAMFLVLLLIEVCEYTLNFFWILYILVAGLFNAISLIILLAGISCYKAE